MLYCCGLIVNKYYTPNFYMLCVCRRKGRARTASQSVQSARRRLNSADSEMLTSGDEANADHNDNIDADHNDHIDHNDHSEPTPHHDSLNEV